MEVHNLLKVAQEELEIQKNTKLLKELIYYLKNHIRKINNAFRHSMQF